MSFEFFRFPDGRSQPHPALPLRGSRWEVAHFHGQFMAGKKNAVLYARHRWICGVRMAGMIPSSALHQPFIICSSRSILVFWCVNGVTAISQQLVSGCLKGMLATRQSNPAVPAVPLWRRPLWRRSSSRSDTALTGSGWLSDCPKIRVDRLVNGLLSRFMFRHFNDF